jgi:hypothetical protein
MSNLLEGYQPHPAQLFSERLDRGERPGISYSVDKENWDVQRPEVSAERALAAPKASVADYSVRRFQRFCDGIRRARLNLEEE